ncbi:hypothetical protein DJ568_15350 [Mucilaginibacter hurinus]|uniref:BD-FAE-like domain-containing protein n=1 Tax=Mucilaginibacter hurinus TaxID=2201324 RepID=A0A367GMI5_9SPHI|nr:carboxylesterase family protein [Mucilaginibacter hurinus]RCH53913.1 hypothetical protein DJ568_15350 [Mucilaginibacter hurinus]
MRALKGLLIFAVCICWAQLLFAQRYLHQAYNQADSVVNIPYGQATNYQHKTEELLLDFYEPRGDKAKKRPLIIYVHGGGFQGGTRKWPSIRIICQKLAMRGYAVASIDYRLDPTFGIKLFSTYKELLPDTNRRAMTDAMHDLKAAIRFFRASAQRYRIDTANIFIGGESAGAITAMMANYVDKPAELRLYPKANPNNIEGQSGNAGYSSKARATLCLCGALPDTTAVESPGDAPFLWVHGEKDSFIQLPWAQEVVTRAANIGLHYKKYIFEGAEHCPWYFGNTNWQMYLDKTVGYIAEFLYPLVTTGKHKTHRK